MPVSPAPDLHGLSHREPHILGFVVAGWPDEQVAAALAITAQEVADCIHRSVYLLAAPSRTGLARPCAPRGPLPPTTSVGRAT